MIKIFETLGRYSFQYRRNGYSLAEIMLVFGIIAIILTSVWTTYAVLTNEVDALVAIAEIQLIRKAANDYKNVPTQQSTYMNIGTDLSNLEPYLGQNTLSGSVNIFGGTVAIEAVTYIYTPARNNLDLDVIYPRIPSKDICWQILEYFGGDVMEATYKPWIYISEGKTISGYIANGYGSIITDPTAGCKRITHQNYELHIRID